MISSISAIRSKHYAKTLLAVALSLFQWKSESRLFREALGTLTISASGKLQL